MQNGHGGEVASWEDRQCGMGGEVKSRDTASRGMSSVIAATPQEGREPGYTPRPQRPRTLAMSPCTAEARVSL